MGKAKKEKKAKKKKMEENAAEAVEEEEKPKKAVHASPWIGGLPANASPSLLSKKSFGAVGGFRVHEMPTGSEQTGDKTDKKSKKKKKKEKKAKETEIEDEPVPTPQRKSPRLHGT